MTEAEVLVSSEESALTRFANSEIHQNVAETNVTINLRFVVGKRVGVASSDRTDGGPPPPGRQRDAIARVVEELDGWGGLPGPTESGGRRGLQPDDRTASPEFRAERPGPSSRAADAAGVTATARSRRARVERRRELEGRARRQHPHDRAADHGLDGSRRRQRLRRGGGGRRLRRSTPGRSVARRRRRRGRLGTPIAVDPGDYPVVLEEYAVVDILDMLGYLGFSALAVQEERSFAEPGKRIGSELVTIVDDGDDPAGLPMAFDYEGVAKQRVVLVERGICRDVVYDAQTAAARRRRRRPATACRHRTRTVRSR